MESWAPYKYLFTWGYKPTYRGPIIPGWAHLVTHTHNFPKISLLSGLNASIRYICNPATWQIATWGQKNMVVVWCFCFVLRLCFSLKLIHGIDSIRSLRWRFQPIWVVKRYQKITLKDSIKLTQIINMDSIEILLLQGAYPKHTTQSMVQWATWGLVVWRCVSRCLRPTKQEATILPTII